MRISRIYLDQDLDLESGDLLQIHGDRAHYIKNVLRLKPGNELLIFNGRGMEASARMGTQTERNCLMIEIDSVQQANRESSLPVHLALGISRAERMDFALQKAVEMGVSTITPLLTTHCVVQLDERKRQQRHEHWQGIVLSACEQSGRTSLPVLHKAEKLPEWMDTTSLQGRALVLDPKSDHGLASIPPPSHQQGCTVLIGPEGGLSHAEHAMAIASGFTPVRLGPRILRTETAALAALTALQLLWGDMG